jgi:hypothetical protein
MIREMFTLLLVQSDLSVDENPEHGNCKPKDCDNPEPGQVFFSQSFKCEKGIVDFQVEPRLFHSPVPSILLVMVLERLGHFCIYNVKLGESVGIVLYLKPRSE